MYYVDNKHKRNQFNLLIQFLNIYKFFFHVLLFILLGCIIINNGLPTALSILGQGPDLENDIEFRVSVNLNEYLMQNDNIPPKFNTKELNDIFPKFEVWGDNHLFLPVYRALKSGVHLTNLGYGEGLGIKDQNPTNKYIYKSIYTSGYNNMPLLLYNFVSKKIQHITTPEEELIATKQVTKFRFFLAYFHLCGMTLLFIALYKRLGLAYAWALGLVFAMNSGVLFVFGHLFYTTVINYFLIAYVVYFYPPLIQNYTYKKYIKYLIGFAFISILHGFFGTTYYILIAFLSTFVLMFYMETNVNIANSNYKISTWMVSILRVAAVALVPLIGFVIIYFIERQEMLALYGNEIFTLWNQRVQANFRTTTFVQYNEFTQITTIPQFLIHYYRYCILFMKLFATMPALWIERFMPILLEFIPPFLLNLRILHLVIMFVLLCVFAYVRLKSTVMTLFIRISVVALYFFLWTLGINLISTLVGVHFMITGWVKSFYVTLIIVQFSIKIIFMLYERYIFDIKKG